MDKLFVVRDIIVVVRLVQMLFKGDTTLSTVGAFGRITRFTVVPGRRGRCAGSHYFQKKVNAVAITIFHCDMWCDMCVVMACRQVGRCC